MIRTATSLMLLLLTAPVGTETVELRDGSIVDLATFECRDINRSTVIQRACYEPTQHAMIVGLKGGYDRFCALSPETFDRFMTAPSMGQFFNQNIRNDAPGGRYDCRAAQSSNG